MSRSGEHWPRSTVRRSFCRFRIWPACCDARASRCIRSRAAWNEPAGVRFLPNQDDRRLLQMQITARGTSIVSAAEGSFNTWLLTMASDLSDHDLGKPVDTMGAIREHIARARDYVGVRVERVGGIEAR